MDCRIKSGNAEHKIVLAAHLRPSCAHHHASKDSPSRGKSRGRRSAERRIHPCPRIADKFPQSAQPVCARKRPDVGGRSPSGAPRRRLPKRPNASAQPRPRFTRRRGRRRYPPSFALKRSTPHPGRSAGGGGDDARAPGVRGSQANSDNLSLYINYMTDSLDGLLALGNI
jgi:hypothetical protein